mgnify:CR=1 FL=1
MKPKRAMSTDKIGKTTSAYRADHEKDVTTRLRKVEGQMRGLILMIESGRPCEDVAVQMAAARTALDKAFYRMMVCSMMEAAHASNIKQQTISDIERAARLLEKLA